MTWSELYALDLLGICLFLVSYYRNCYRRGYRVDFWHVQLFLSCVLPNLLMLPFARSEFNGPTLGRDMPAVVAALPQVFLISLAGYFFILIGGSLWYLRLGVGARKAFAHLLDLVPQASRMLMSSRRVLVFQSALCLTLQAAVLTLYFSQDGFGFNLRAYTMAHPALRPVALLISNYTVIIASHSLARYLEKKENILLACTLLLTLGMIFFGARSNILSIYLNVLLCYLVLMRDRLSLIRLTLVTTGTIVFFLYLGSVRAGAYSFISFLGALVALLLFGDTFSDLRDFAWVYAHWDHVYWAGRTYLAALMGFIPRVASTFRDTWGLGVATATTVGFDPQIHPGVRPGTFGESFFNFGLPGVICIALLLGIGGKWVDLEIKRTLSGPRASMMKAFAATYLLFVLGNLALTAGFSGVYILAGVYAFSWLCLQVARLAR